MQISDTVTSDSGLYQCVATNPLGEIRSVARILVQADRSPPSPPSNLTCRPFSSTSVCLRWQPTPPNVPKIKAYTVHYMRSDGGPEQQQPTDEMFATIDSLEPNTYYRFYLRAYLREAASEQSKSIMCMGQEMSKRWISLKPITSQILNVEWNPLFNDTPCGQIGQYKVQWRKYGHISDSVKLVMASTDQDSYSYQITGK